MMTLKSNFCRLHLSFGIIYQIVIILLDKFEGHIALIVYNCIL